MRRIVRCVEMDRRKFLQGCGSVAVIGMVPAIALGDVRMTATEVLERTKAQSRGLHAWTQEARWDFLLGDDIYWECQWWVSEREERRDV